MHGDVSQSGLGLTDADRELIRNEVTHVLSCFGSVDWQLGPAQTLELHVRGTERLLQLGAEIVHLERFVHVSSVLVFGRVARVVGNGQLDVNQSFRNWYEYGKYLAEMAARRDDLPVRIVRLGPVLGQGEQLLRSANFGLLAAVPSLVRGYPVRLAEGGRALSYVSDADTVGEVLSMALTDDTTGDVWTYFDEHGWSVAQVLVGLCSPWGAVPRIIDLPGVGIAGRLLGRRFGAPAAILDYNDGWPTIPIDVLSDLPAGLPPSPDGYIEAAGRLLRNHASRLLEPACTRS
jgi:nucleoside-diphosphate-sugar epimerase